MKATRIERTVRRLMKAGRAALVAQERALHWQQFGTNSKRTRMADAKFDAALAGLARAEADVEEALLQESVGG